MLIMYGSRTMLNCGKHICPQRCHQLFDHSRVQCKHIIQDKCPQNHAVTWQCWRQSAPCGKCEAEARRREAQRQRDHKLDLQRQANERAYAQRLAELDEEIAHERRLQQEHGDQLDRNRVLQQREKDLANARVATNKATVVKSPPSEMDAGTKSRAPKAETSNEGKSASPFHDSSLGKEQKDEQRDERSEISQARSDWDYQKRVENADNEHLDALMGMIGLESVKLEVLAIKTKVDTWIRQGANVKDERFGVSLLGNPGTGMNRVSLAAFDLHC